ncbi:MAG: hypothetical protein RL134_406 [Actinomycetota bacterium]
MRFASPVIIAVSLALTVSACTSSPPESATSSPTPSVVEPTDDGAIAAAGTPVADVQPWLAGVVPGGDASGPVSPTDWPSATVKAAGTSTSLTPTLVAPGIDGEIRVEIVDLSAGGGFGADGTGEATELVWSGSGRGAGTEVPADTLRQGATYAWRALRNEQVVGGPWGFGVDVVRTGNAPMDQLYGVNVNMVSGVVSTRWASPSFTGAAGGIVIALGYRAPVEAKPVSFPGLPAGWSWDLPGSGLIEARESEITSGSGDDAGPRSVVLLNAQGIGQTFVRTETGAYVPGLADGTATGYGSAGTLIRIGDGIWQFTAPDGTLTRFEGGRTVSEWNAGLPTVAYTWDADGRLLSMGDGISRTLSMIYAGTGDCPAASWGNGFDVAEGMWCATVNPDGSVTGVGYTGGQIGLIADAGGVSAGFGWDRAGRLSAVRSTSAAAAAATAGGAWAGPEFTTQIAYDAVGRVESLTAPAPAPGVDRVQRSYSYPADASSSELTASATQSVVGNGAPRLVSSDLGSGRVLEITVESETWKTLKRRDVDGRSTTVKYDEESGVVLQGTDETGRTVQTLTDKDSIATEVVGPFVGSDQGAMRNERFLDATIDNPAAGTDSPTTPWYGLAAVVWSDDAGTPAYWDRDLLGDSLSAELNVPGSWNAVATGTWKVPESGVWKVEATSSDGVGIDVTLDGVRCTSDVGEPCEIKLSKGDHALALSLVGQGAGSFAVRAGRGGDAPKALPIDALRPGYRAATLMSINDVVDGRNVGTQVIENSRPWSPSPESIRSAGDLVTRFTYEPTDPRKGSWGRPLDTTTPGGAVLSTSYYGNDEQVEDPCTGTSSPQVGQPKTQVRYDGVRVTTVYNAQGYPASVTTEGAGGEGQRTCATYDPAGRPLTTSTKTLGGEELASSSTERVWQDGQLVTTVTSTSPQGTFTTRSVTDILDQIVSYTDAWGTTTDYTLDAEGLIVKRTTTPKGASAPALVVEYGFEKGSGSLSTVSANGEVLAALDYAETGLLDSVTYPGGVTATYAYAAPGTVESMALKTADLTFSQDRERNAAGRTLASTLRVRSDGDDVLQSRWEYGFDDAGRLTKATLSSKGDVDVVGGDKRTFTYSYGSPEACPTTAGADFNRTGGSRDGVDFVTCYDAKFRMASTTDPRLAAKGKAEATYDALGRLTALSGDVPLEITWGAGTTPLAITQGGAVTTLTNSGPSLIEYAVDGVATRLSYASAGQAPALLLDDQGKVTAMLVGLPGGALARLDAAGALSQIDYTDIFSAALTSTAPDGTSLGSGQAHLATRFGPYGEPLVSSDALAPAATYGWQAGPRNPTVGGWHDITLTARPYHPWLGQFLAFDPAVGASTTGYGYGDGSPVDRPDFSGNFPIFETLAIAGGILAGVAGVGMGQVKVGASKAGRTLVIGGAAVGVAAAVTGIVGTWTTETTDSSQGLQIASTVVAGLGILAIGGAAAVQKYREAQYMTKLRAYADDAIKASEVAYTKELQSLRQQQLAMYAPGLTAEEGLELVAKYEESKAILAELMGRYQGKQVHMDALHKQDLEFLSFYNGERPRWFN